MRTPTRQGLYVTALCARVLRQQPDSPRWERTARKGQAGDPGAEGGGVFAQDLRFEGLGCGLLGPVCFFFGFRGSGLDLMFSGLRFTCVFGFVRVSVVPGLRA